MFLLTYVQPTIYLIGTTPNGAQVAEAEKSTTVVANNHLLSVGNVWWIL
jgi:hypothetical protein